MAYSNKAFLFLSNFLVNTGKKETRQVVQPGSVDILESVQRLDNLLIEGGHTSRLYWIRGGRSSSNGLRKKER